jgi:uncharacterized spore protein YtfJ
MYLTHKRGGANLRKKWFLVLAMGLVLFFLIEGLTLSQEKQQKQPPKAQVTQEDPVVMIAKAMTERLTKNLQVKNIVGDPIKVGNVTVIPIIMIDIGYGGGGSSGPVMQTGGASQIQMGGSGFGMKGEAKVLGFIVLSKAGVKFIAAEKAPRK